MTQNAGGFYQGPTDEVVKLLQMVRVFLVKETAGRKPVSGKTAKWQTKRYPMSGYLKMIVPIFKLKSLKLKATVN
jgi:hypothetical protein